MEDLDRSEIGLVIDTLAAVTVAPVGAVLDEGLAGCSLAILQVSAITIVKPEIVIVPDPDHRRATGQACQRRFPEEGAVFAAHCFELARVNVRSVAGKAEQVG